MMSRRNPSRQGPRKVWSSYRTLRVPIELFDDVKYYLEEKKLLYLANKSAPHIDYSVLKEEQTVDQLTKILIDIQQKLAKILKNQGIYETAPYLLQRLPAKERLKLFLQAAVPGDKFTTQQLAEKVGMPAATCRQVMQNLTQEDPSIHKIPGRPNKYYADG